MNKQKQKGSALVILTIILVIAIVAALGFVVWQNITKKDSTSFQEPSNNNTAEPVVKSKTAQIDPTFPAKLSWTYPENWTIKSEGSGPKNPSDTVTQKFTLTSPNNKYEVIYYVGINGGLGGTCEPGGDALKLVQRTAVPNFDKTVFMEIIAETPDGFRYKSSLFQNNNDIQSIKEGDSYCKTYLGYIIPLTEDGNMVILAAEINIKQFDSIDQYGPTEIYPKEISTIENVFADTEYKEAVNILLSTTTN